MPTHPPLLTRPEQFLYGRLVRAFPGHVIMAHVAIGPLLGADIPGIPSEYSLAGIDRVADFVVLRPDFTAVAVVEFAVSCGDSQREQSIERRRVADRLLRDAGIKIVRVAADDLPSEAALKSLVAALPVQYTPVRAERPVRRVVAAG